MSELPKTTCEISIESATGEARTVVTVESSPPIMAMAWVNFLKQRLHVLQLDYNHVTVDRIVVASRPQAVESVAQLVQSAAESADHYVKAARRSASTSKAPNDTAVRAAQRRAELGERAARFGER
jgi:phage protein D